MKKNYSFQTRMSLRRTLAVVSFRLMMFASFSVAISSDNAETAIDASRDASEAKFDVSTDARKTRVDASRDASEIEAAGERTIFSTKGAKVSISCSYNFTRWSFFKAGWKRAKEIVIMTDKGWKISDSKYSVTTSENCYATRSSELSNNGNASDNYHHDNNDNGHSDSNETTADSCNATISSKNCAIILTVLAARHNDTGLYTCKDAKKSSTVKTHLVVVDNSSPAHSPNENDGIQVRKASCSARYSTYNRTPSIRWTYENNGIASNTSISFVDDKTDGFSLMTSTLTVDRNMSISGDNTIANYSDFTDIYQCQLCNESTGLAGEASGEGNNCDWSISCSVNFTWGHDGSLSTAATGMQREESIATESRSSLATDRVAMVTQIGLGLLAAILLIITVAVCAVYHIRLNGTKRAESMLSGTEHQIMGANAYLRLLTNQAEGRSVNGSPLDHVYADASEMPAFRNTYVDIPESSTGTASRGVNGMSASPASRPRLPRPRQTEEQMPRRGGMGENEGRRVECGGVVAEEGRVNYGVEEEEDDSETIGGSSPVNFVNHGCMTMPNRQPTVAADVSSRDVNVPKASMTSQTTSGCRSPPAGHSQDITQKLSPDKVKGSYSGEPHENVPAKLRRKAGVETTDADGRTNKYLSLLDDHDSVNDEDNDQSNVKINENDNDSDNNSYSVDNIVAKDGEIKRFDDLFVRRNKYLSVINDADDNGDQVTTDSRLTRKSSGDLMLSADVVGETNTGGDSCWSTDGSDVWLFQESSKNAALIDIEHIYSQVRK